MSVEVKIDPKAIKMVPLSEIKLNPKNRNQHPQEQIDRFVKILRANGFRSLPVISNRTGQLVAGEGRYLAMKQEGMTEMLCSFQDFDSEEEEYAHGIADNALQTWSSLDLSGINADILDLGPFDIDMLGIRNFGVDVSERLDHHVEDSDLVESVNSGDENSEWAGMPEFEQGEDYIKLIFQFKTELERDLYVKTNNIFVDRKMNKQWICQK